MTHPDDPVWPDMDFMLERQDKSRLLFGALPTSFKEAQKKLVLAGGASVTNFARGRRNNVPIVDSNKSQFFRNRSVLGQLYQERMYKEPSTQEATDLTRKLIQTIKASKNLQGRSSNMNSPRLVTTGAESDWQPLEILEELRK